MNGENILIKRKSEVVKSGLIAKFSGVKFGFLLNECIKAENECVEVKNECAEAENECAEAENECVEAESECAEAESECAEAENKCDSTNKECGEAKQKKSKVVFRGFSMGCIGLCSCCGFLKQNKFALILYI